MEIKLLRTEKNSKHTLGSMYNDDCFFGHTIEPVHASCADVDEVTVLPEGTYAMIVRINPMAGTPCIKLIGKSTPANASIRCCNSQNAKNPSITLVTDKDCSGSYKEADVDAWTKLLDYINKNKTVSLVIL